MDMDRGIRVCVLCVPMICVYGPRCHHLEITLIFGHTDRDTSAQSSEATYQIDDIKSMIRTSYRTDEGEEKSFQ